MAGILLSPKQIDSRSGILTLFDSQSNNQWSPDFEVVNTPYMLVAYNLLPGETVKLYNVARLKDGVKQAPFAVNGATVELTNISPTAIVPLSGVYRLVMPLGIGRVVVMAIPQKSSASLPSPNKAAEHLFIDLAPGVFSEVLLVYARSHTITVFDLSPTGQVEVFVTAGGLTAPYAPLGVPVVLTSTDTVAFLDRTGDYTFKSNEACMLLATPNWVDFRNPYITKGDAGAIGPTGAQGEIGPPGPQGQQGIPGAQGEQGVQGNPGLTAYEVAVLNGYVGTEAEWLASLEGPQGPQGIQGEVGPQGIQGPIGLTGPQGEVGPQGIQGETGPQGIQGEVGPIGLTGPQGEIGPQGIQGEVGPQGIQGETGATGPGVAAGGTAGQFLWKLSGANYDTGWRTLIAADIPDLDTAKITSGVLADARVAETNVTQHQAALSILPAQIVGLTISTTDTADSVAKRTATGDLEARLMRSTFADQATISGAMAFRINNGADNYIRFCNSPAAIRSFTGAAATSDLLTKQDFAPTIAGVNGDYTLVSTDRNRVIGKTNTTANTYTVDPASLIIGGWYQVANYAASGNTILAPAAGVTMRLMGSATTGNRTLAPRGYAWVWIRAATEVWVHGFGVS